MKRTQPMRRIRLALSARSRWWLHSVSDSTAEHAFRCKGGGRAFKFWLMLSIRIDRLALVLWRIEVSAGPADVDSSLGGER
jgi:hypothetical protein